MTLKDYFENSSGTGVLSTADSAGAVNAAVYSKPHILDDGTVAFVMLERLTHHNLQSNPFAAYLFLEDGPGHQGIRLHLKQLRVESDPRAVDPYLKRQLTAEQEQRTGPRHLAVFSVLKILPLSGQREPKADRVL